MNVCYIFVSVLHTVSSMFKTEEDVEEAEHFLKTLVCNHDFCTRDCL